MERENRSRDRDTHTPENQARDLLDTYAQAQERLLENWTALLERFQVRTADEALWGRFEQLAERPLQVFQEQTRSLVDAQLRLVLNAQSIFARHWLDNFNPAQYLPTLFDTWARQTQRMAEKNAEASREAMERLLEASKRFDPLKVTEAWSGTFQRSVEAFEEVSREVAERQQALVEQTTEQAEEGAKKVAGSVKRVAEKASGERAA